MRCKYMDKLHVSTLLTLYVDATLLTTLSHKVHVSTLLTLYVDATLLTSSCTNASMLAAIFVLRTFASFCERSEWPWANTRLLN
jgi:hypothetical protein